MSTHCFQYRPYDYMYDPIFSVSGPTDHYKAAVKAKSTTAKFQICPIFPNMFSDLPNYPRQRLVKRTTMSIPKYVEPTTKSKTSIDTINSTTSEVLGADRLKFFKMPVVNFPPRDLLPYRTLATFHIKKVPKSTDGKKQISRGTNTVYRNAEAQTHPWEPPYKIIGEGSPEVLLLDFLKWGAGLPAGQHEIELIERARMKRAWEKAIKPNVADESSMAQLRDYMEALELDEWAFREQEIQEIQDMRMELLENMLVEVHEKSKQRSEIKLQNIIDRTLTEKDKKLEKIKKQGKRALRKLEIAARGINNKYHKVGIIDEYVDFKSEIYAPMMRHGEHPKRWHQVIDEKNKKYKAQFIGIKCPSEEKCNHLRFLTSLGVENISTLPSWLDRATKITEREIDAKLPTRHICMRETKWTTPVLKELHQELKSMRVTEPRKSCSLLKRIEVEATLQYSSEAEGIPEDIETQYQAVVKLQSIIRGRATQVLIYEGRDRCRKLIETLRTSEGLLQTQKEEKLKKKLIVKMQQRKEFIAMQKLNQVKESLERLRGNSIGTLLDFLNKELRRLLVERKAHALCLSLERDLHTREAGEAGRRQRELRRRREHDEMFKQIVKVHQETVDMYLNDIIAEGMDFASKDETTNYIKRLAKQIDTETEELYQVSATVESENEIVADMVHHFLLSEANKEIVRHNIHLKQKENLRAIHDEIYGTTENLPKVERIQIEEEFSEDVEEIVKPIVKEIYERALEEAVADPVDYVRQDILLPLVDQAVYKSEVNAAKAALEEDIEDDDVTTVFSMTISNDKLDDQEGKVQRDVQIVKKRTHDIDASYRLDYVDDID